MGENRHTKLDIYKLSDEERGQSMHYRSIFVSDVHLGSRWSKVDQLAAFLSSSLCDRLYLVGDIIDGWKFRREALKTRSSHYLLQLLLKLSEKTEVFYIPGNHDDFLDEFRGKCLGGIHILEKSIHTARDGRRYLVTHGDELDIISKHSEWLARIGDVAYETSLALNNGINRFFSSENQWSFSKSAKRVVKEFVKCISGYEKRVTEIAQKHDVQGLVCGHIHHPVMKKIGNILYCNTGDWLESCSAVVENQDGSLQSLLWQQIQKQAIANQNGINVLPAFPFIEIPVPFLSCKSR